MLVERTTSLASGAEEGGTDPAHLRCSRYISILSIVAPGRSLENDRQAPRIFQNYLIAESCDYHVLTVTSARKSSLTDIGRGRGSKHGTSRFYVTAMLFRVDYRVDR